MERVINDFTSDEHKLIINILMIEVMILKSILIGQYINSQQDIKIKIQQEYNPCDKIVIFLKDVYLSYFSLITLISGIKFDKFFKIDISAVVFNYLKLLFNYILRFTFYKTRLTGKQDRTPLGQPGQSVGREGERARCLSRGDRRRLLMLMPHIIHDEITGQR